MSTYPFVFNMDVKSSLNICTSCVVINLKSNVNLRQYLSAQVMGIGNHPLKSCLIAGWWDHLT